MEQGEAQSSEGRYRILVEGITDYAICMLDAAGLVTSWNRGAERFKGYSEGEIIGQHFSRFYTEEDRAIDLPQTALRTAQEEGRFEQEGLAGAEGMGTRFWAHVWSSIRSATLLDGNLVGYAKITRDLLRNAAEPMVQLRESLSGTIPAARSGRNRLRPVV